MLSMSLLPMFTTLLWNYPPYHQLSGRFTILKSPIPYHKWWLERQIHGVLVQLFPLSMTITCLPLGHHVVSLLLW